MLSEPRSGRLAAWGNALLAGLSHRTTRRSPSSGRTRCTGSRGCRVSRGPVGLTLALGRLRALGATGLRVALPAPGHPLGLSGPPEFNARALEARGGGGRLRARALGLVPEVYEAGPEGDRACRGGLALSGGAGGAARRCARRWARRSGSSRRRCGRRPRLLSRARCGGLGAGGRGGRRRVPGAGRAGPRGTGPRLSAAGGAGAGAGPAGQPAGLALAYEHGHGGAVSASEMAARGEALRPVERVARRAQVAAYNAYVEERERYN